MKTFLISLVLIVCIFLCGMSSNKAPQQYLSYYHSQVDSFSKAQESLIEYIQAMNSVGNQVDTLKSAIWNVRIKMKSLDFWFRYFEPVAYRSVNGPLPVEWENEVFEKFEKPYKRAGAGLSLAELYLDEPSPAKDSLVALLKTSQQALNTFRADSITQFCKTPDHFFFANRLFLLNLAAIYTTGFDCPDSSRIIPELVSMLGDVSKIYYNFSLAFPSDSLTQNYLELYSRMEQFVVRSGFLPSGFDHFNFIKNYVNPLFALNQKFIHDYHAISRNFNDYSLNNNCYSIFDKALYKGQNDKGIFLPVDDENALKEIRQTGKMLFYDPILSGNGKRSCASCHKPTEFFTDTTVASSLQFESQLSLPRNTPSLINVVYNHLIMQDGKHYTLQNQVQEVISNPSEMDGGNADNILQNVLSCAVYKKAFDKYVKLTPNYPELSIDHIVSSLTMYFASFSGSAASFDDAMNAKSQLNADAVNGFNLFMSKAKCGTCHFIPQFNGVKPPYVSSEFEVLGVPQDSSFRLVSEDSGRYKVNPAEETLNAFRTGTVRNSSYTKPYMHNGVFKSIDEVIDFYDQGGGTGHGLNVNNQTLPPDSLHLSILERKQLKAFMRSLDENIEFVAPPSSLPKCKIEKYRDRVVGGVY